jgi:hypothetical protein
MATILESLGEILTPDVISQIAKGLGLDPNMVDSGLKAVGPLLMGSLNKTASTPEGASSLMNMLPQEGGDNLVSSLMSSITGGQAGGTAADLLNGVLGPGIGAIANTLSQKLGFDVKPLLTLAIPAILGLLSKRAKEENLDATGVADLLKSETKAYTSNPANKETAALVKEALKAGDTAAELRKQFSDADWTKVRMAPIAALYRVASASPSKGTGAAQELQAAIDTVSGTLQQVSPTSLIGAAFGVGLTQADLDLLKGEAPGREKIIRTIQDAVAIVAAHAPNDVDAYKSMIVSVATNVANAAKEGGFLGMGGKQVSKEEEAAVAEIAGAVGLAAARR